jgi:hypothetical protein
MATGAALAAAAAPGTVSGAAPAAASSVAIPAPLIGSAPLAKSKSTTVTSRNWSGYVDTGTTFTSVAGSWTQPAATCPANKLEQAAFWVGLDGYTPTDTSVEQVGTDADCVKGTKKVPGGPRYYAWYELYPNPLQVLTSDPVFPGDAITASVSGSGAAYTVAISDVASGVLRWSYSLPVTAPAVEPDASAEWIAEAPVTCTPTGTCKAVPLADFGAVTFTGASANGEPINGTGFTSIPITMTKSARGTGIEAQPSALATGGSGFSVAWVSL